MTPSAGRNMPFLSSMSSTLRPLQRRTLTRDKYVGARKWHSDATTVGLLPTNLKIRCSVAGHLATITGLLPAGGYAADRNPSAYPSAD